VRSASLEALTPPRAGSASLEGPTPILEQGPPRSRAKPPSGGVRLARGHPHVCCPRSCPCVQAFNALTPQDTHHDSDTPGNRAPTLFRQLPKGNPSPPLFCTVRQGRCQLRDTVPPTPVRLTRHALEGWPAAPSNIFYLLMQGHAVTSDRRDRSSPSLSTLCDHPRHCSTTPGTVTTSPKLLDNAGTRRCHDCHCVTYGPPSTAPSNWPTTAASQPTTTPPPSKPPLVTPQVFN
jgi:hypothetical protein